MVNLDVQYTEQAEEPPSKDEFQDWVNLALINEKDVEVSLSIVGEAESQSLNKEYRNKDKPTNVLSFPMEIPQALVDEIDMPAMLGDLIICAPIVEQEAVQQEKTSTAHWAHMVIHGMLHLQGYDHISDEQAKQMEDLEIQLLQQLGIDNPYGKNS
jgi:probable rRNA maturation factor